MSRRHLLPLLAACTLLALGGARAAEPNPTAADEGVLKQAEVGTDGPALLEFFRKRTVTEADRSRIASLVKQLGDADFEARQKASAALVEMGPTVMKPLADALKDPDPEVVRRAEECLRLLERAADPYVTAAAARLLADRRPDGAAEALLNFLPFTADETVIEEVRTALTGLALRDGKPEKVLVQAVEDKVAVRRAAAAEALVRAGDADLRAPLHKLLKDADPTVRLWVGLAFAGHKDKEAVPVLVDLLGELPRDQAWRAEDVLCRLAGEQVPNVPLGKDDEGRKKCRDAWAKWWADQGSKLDLAKIDLSQRLLGYTLVVQLDLKGALNGKVAELGADGKPRWSIDGLKYAIDAQVVGNDRVLITEYTGRCVSERNFKGEVVWEKKFEGNQLPLAAQRLPNGNTFVACRNLLLELDRDGKEVSSVARANSDVMAAQKLRTGEVVLLTNAGNLVRLDAAGKELKSLPLGANGVFGGGLDVLPNGRVLVPLYRENKVVELDPDGKAVWEASVPQPSYATRLPNGHTIVVSAGTQQAVELDQAGKEVWKYKSDDNPGRLMRVKRR